MDEEKISIQNTNVQYGFIYLSFLCVEFMISGVSFFCVAFL